MTIVCGTVCDDKFTEWIFVNMGGLQTAEYFVIATVYAYLVRTFEPLSSNFKCSVQAMVNFVGHMHLHAVLHVVDPDVARCLHVVLARCLHVVHPPDHRNRLVAL